jgi:hypothetical protein
MAKAPASPTHSTSPAKCLFEVTTLPQRYFGEGRACRLRKSVLQAIAKYANPDGTNAYPSLKTLAEHCFVTERSVRTTITWLASNNLLEVEYKKGFGTKGKTNRYTVKIPRDPEAQTSTSEDAGPGSLEDVPGSLEGPDPEVSESDPEAQTSSNRPLNRPLNRPSDINRPNEQNEPDFQKRNYRQKHGQRKNRSEELREAALLARELTFISRGTVRFLDNNISRISRHLAEFSYDELREAFEHEFALAEDDDERLAYLAHNFSQTADQTAHCNRRRKQEREIKQQNRCPENRQSPQTSLELNLGSSSLHANEIP